MYNCIIVDDNEVDRLMNIAMAKKYSFLNIIGSYANVQDAIQAIHQHKIDLIISDIEMPGITGIEFRNQFRDIPACIFITSYPEYALDSFEVEALDFIVKPVKNERFETSMVRFQKYMELRQKADSYEHSLGPDSLFIKVGHEQHKIKLFEIIYLEALKDYTRIITETKKYTVLTTLGNLIKEAAFQSFIRIHRSYAIQKNYIDKIGSQSLFIKNIELPIGRAYKDSLSGLI